MHIALGNSLLLTLIFQFIAHLLGILRQNLLPIFPIMVQTLVNFYNGNIDDIQDFLIKSSGAKISQCNKERAFCPWLAGDAVKRGSYVRNII